MVSAVLYYFSLETDSFMIGGFYTDPFYTLDVLNKKNIGQISFE